MSRRTVAVVVAAAAVALAAIAIRAALRRPPTDEEAILALLDGAARAAEERRVSDAVAAVSERFSGQGLDRQGVKQAIAFHVLRGEWVSVSIAGARVAVAGDRARANVDAVLARASGKGKPLAAMLPGEASAHRFELTIEREEEGWRVVAGEWRPLDLSGALAGPPDPAPPAVEPAPVPR